MTSSLVDSNVIIDLMTAHPQFASWGQEKLVALGAIGPLVVNQICYAETAAYFKTLPEFDIAMARLGVKRDDLPWESCGRAGLAHRAYRQSGGSRDRILPDFLIGAHAAERGFRILTRDGTRYRNYFPQVEVIAPDTHP